MNDHVAAHKRLAYEKHAVCTVQPDWTLELLTVLCLALFLALTVTLGQLAIATAEASVARGERDQWMELALAPPAPDNRPTVRLQHEGLGFKCQNFNVRREWEKAVAAKCKELGGLLQAARTTP